MGNPPDTFAAILDALHEDCRKRIAALEAENERLRGLLRSRTQDAHACRHLGAIIGPAHNGSFEDCLNQACCDTRAALAPEGRCSCYRLAEISSKEWAERTPCGPHCDALVPEPS